jgi:hypothetical protein
MPSFSSHVSPTIQLLLTYSPRQMSHFEALHATLRAMAPLAPSAACSKAPAIKKDTFGSFKVTPSSKRQKRSRSRPPPPFTSLHFAATMLSSLTVSPRPALMSCSVRLSVMPHSATSSARGDEISTTFSWNSGVNSSQF